MADFQNSIARIEKIFWLPGIIHSEPSDAFADFFDECDSIDGLPEIASVHSLAVDEDMSVREAAEETLCQMARRQRDGFIFEVAAPVTSHHRVGSFQYSWGHYTCKWMYARTLDEMAKKALSFEAERLAHDGKLSPGPSE